MFGVAKEWEKHVVFVLGRKWKVAGPGLYFYPPGMGRVVQKIDTRIISFTAPAQRGLTKDNIPVKVDAVVFYRVTDVEKAVLEVDNYHVATQLRARTAIRDMVGKSELDELLQERASIGERIREHIENFAAKWGVKVLSVEIKDVIVAKELEDAISREAAAEREKRARIILANAEIAAADGIVAAAESYRDKPMALQLRSMNMLYEICMKGQAATVFVPTEKGTGAMPSFQGLKSFVCEQEDILPADEAERLPCVDTEGGRAAT